MKRTENQKRVLLVLLALVAVVGIALALFYRSKYTALAETLERQTYSRSVDMEAMLQNDGDDAYAQYVQGLAQYDQIYELTGTGDAGLTKVYNYFAEKGFFDDSLTLRQEMAERIAALGNPIPTDQDTATAVMELVAQTADAYAAWQAEQGTN